MLVDELVDLGWCGFLSAPICFMKIYAIFDRPNSSYGINGFVYVEH